MNKLATLGIKNVKLALIDKKTNKVLVGADGITGEADDTTGIFTVDENTSYGVASLNLTNLAGSLTDIYGSNKIVYVAQGKAAPQAVLTVNQLPNEIKARVLGQTADGKGGFELGGTSDAYVALLAESAESFDEDKPVYVGLYKVVGQEASANMQTNNAAENRTQDAITFRAVERGADGFGKFFYSDVEGFDEEAMTKDVFLPASTTVNP